MRRTASLLTLLAAGALGACAAENGESGSASDMPATARAALADSSGADVGTATLTQMADGVRLVVDARGLPQGGHGLHVHMTGRCDPPDFTTAGSHWNPTEKVHGKDAPGGPHMGDLPNLLIGTDGSGRLEATLPGARLSDGNNMLLDADGAAVVIHTAPDDYRTDPSGNSGGRIACGVATTG